MILDSDTMTCAQCFRSILNAEFPDRVPIFLMGMPEYGDFFQEFISRQNELDLIKTMRDAIYEFGGY